MYANIPEKTDSVRSLGCSLLFVKKDDVQDKLTLGQGRGLFRSATAVCPVSCGGGGLPWVKAWPLGARLPWLFPPSFLFPPLLFPSPWTEKQVEEGSVRSVFLKRPVLALVSGI